MHVNDVTDVRSEAPERTLLRERQVLIWLGLALVAIALVAEVLRPRDLAVLQPPPRIPGQSSSTLDEDREPGKEKPEGDRSRANDGGADSDTPEKTGGIAPILKDPGNVPDLLEAETKLIESEQLTEERRRAAARQSEAAEQRREGPSASGRDEPGRRGQ